MSFHTPDIADQRLTTKSLPIDFVGIQNLEMPVLLKGQKGPIPALIDAFVSLDDPKARGVHMSRIYRTLHDFFKKEPLSFSVLARGLRKVIASQGKASKNGRLRVSAKWLEDTKALKSALSGWRYYPFFYQTEFQEKTEDFRYIFGGEVLYSSTCPCSASLSREVVHKEFEKEFPAGKPIAFTRKKVSQWLKTEKSQTATPHAQKSRATFKILLSEREKNHISLLPGIIKKVEQALGTPVQTAVKREDEMEFARLNGKNMLFCEDAVRRIGELFRDRPFLDYHIRVRHYESLHPFTVESSLAKGVKGGWQG